MIKLSIKMIRRPNFKKKIITLQIWFLNLNLFLKKIGNVETNQMTKGYTVDVLTSTDFQEFFKFWGEVIKVLEGLINRKQFRISPFRKVKEKLFASRQKYKDEGNGFLQDFVELIMNGFYGVQIRKGNNEFFKWKSKNWEETEYVD